MLKLMTFALALTASLPVAANPARETRSEVVRFDDLNLSSTAGVAALERRINSAARRVCEYRDARGSTYLLSQDQAVCMKNALASARQQVAAKTGTAILKG